MIDVNKFNYFLFTVDIVTNSTEIDSWLLPSGKYWKINSIKNEQITDNISIRRMREQLTTHLSEIYILNRLDNRSIISFCETKADFVKLLAKKQNNSLFNNNYRSELPEFYWHSDYESNNRMLSFASHFESIFKDYQTIFLGKPTFNPSPIILYIEPKDSILYSQNEMIKYIDELAIEFGINSKSKIIFSDCITASFLNFGYRFTDSFIFFSNKNLNNNNNTELRFNEFFFVNLDCLIVNYILDHFINKLEGYNYKVENFLSNSQVLKNKIITLKKYQKYHFSILELRNNLNSLRIQTQAVLPLLSQIESGIIFNYNSQHSRNINMDKHPLYSLPDLSVKIKQSTSKIEALIKNVDEKIKLQVEFTLSYFQSINSIENIELQKKIFLLSKLVILLTIIVVLFTQWGDNTIINIIIEFFKKM